MPFNPFRAPEADAFPAVVFAGVVSVLLLPPVNTVAKVSEHGFLDLALRRQAAAQPKAD